ncbi:hypothetical protein Tco_0928406 [Tanacetum coccineum]
MMEFLLEPSSNKLCGRTSKYGKSNAYTLEDLKLGAGNPIKEVLLKLNLPNHSLIPAKSDLLPHAHAQTTKTYYKHQDSRIKKAQELKTKTSVNSDIKDPSLETKLQGVLLESFQEDAKYEHVSQDTRSQDGKDVKDNKGERFKDLGTKDKVKRQ